MREVRCQHCGLVIVFDSSATGQWGGWRDLDGEVCDVGRAGHQPELPEAGPLRPGY